MHGLSALRRHQQGIGLWLLALVFATGCVLLGRWQLHRYQDKHETAALLSRNYDAAPVPLHTLLASPGSTFEPDLQWRPVSVSGSYDTAGTRVVRNRPRRGGGAEPVYGYEVVVPLRLDDGSALLVDRGWLPNGTSGSRPGQAPDSVPEPPQGRVSLVARLHAGEPDHDQNLPAGQIGSIAVASIGADLALPVYAGYGALVSETPSVRPSPAALDRPRVDGGEGINASYAVQWVLFALLGLGFPVWVRRQRRAVGQPDDERAVEPVPVRPRRQRIWDADDE